MSDDTASDDAVSDDAASDDAASDDAASDETASDDSVSDDAASDDDTRRLVLMRHAKSDWPDVADHERPLAKRGRRDAPYVGRWLAREGYVPDAVVCSTARRARETWDLAGAALAEAGATPPVRYEPRVYEATVLGLLMLVREFPDDDRTVLIVGHNPGLAELAVGLAAPPPEPPSAFPTAAVAVLGLTGDWAAAGPGEACLLAFAIPADMKAQLSPGDATRGPTARELQVPPNPLGPKPAPTGPRRRSACPPAP